MHSVMECLFFYASPAEALAKEGHTPNLAGALPGYTPIVFA